MSSLLTPVALFLVVQLVSVDAGRATGTLNVHAYRNDASGIRANVQVSSRDSLIADGFTDSLSGVFVASLTEGIYRVMVDPPSPYGTRIFDSVAINTGQTTTLEALVRYVLEPDVTSIGDTLHMGQTDTRTFWLANTTADSVRFRITDDSRLARPTQTHIAPPPRHARSATAPAKPKGARDTEFGTSPHGSGGPDLFGHRWIDSDSPGGPTFEWLNIDSLGTPITVWTGSRDDGYASIELPWSFSFYGGTYSSAYVCTNGFLSFLFADASYFNTSLPNVSMPNNTVYAFWDDFDLSNSGRVTYYNDAARTRFIIQYTNVKRYAAPSDSMTFQVILYPNGSIVYQYLHMTGNVNSATIGIENVDGTDALQAVYNAPYVHNNLAVRFTGGTGWPPVQPDRGVLPPHTGVMISVTFSTDDLVPWTTYHAILIIDAYHPDASSPVIIPVTLRTLGWIDGPILQVWRYLNFPATPVGTNRLDSITARNIGIVGPLQITSITSSSPVFTITPGSAVLMPGEWVSVRVGYTPIASGVDTGRAVFISNSVWGPRTDVLLTGIATNRLDTGITIISPNGGEVWQIGETRSLIWSESGIDTAEVEFSHTGSSGPWQIISPAYSGRDTIPFVVPGPASDNCFIRVSWRSHPAVFDTNDAPFSIVTGPASIWQLESSGITTDLFSVKAISPSVAWAAGIGGVVRRTVNGGNTWESAGAIGADIYALTAVDASTAFVAVSPAAAMVYKTTDGGQTWNRTDSVSSTGAFFDAIEMNSPTTGFVLGDPLGGHWLLRQTTNTGNTWFNGPSIPWVPSEYIGLNCMTWYDSLDGWFFSSPGYIYRTTSGGAVWTGTSPPSPPGPVWFNQLTLGLSGHRLRSTDGGASWMQTQGTIPEAVNGLSGIHGSQVFWAIAGRNVYSSSNAGDSWSNSPPSGYSGSAILNDISFVQAGNISAGWAVGTAGTILHFVAGGDGVKEGGGEMPTEFSLSQNYPNPFNPTTKIGFQVTGYGRVSLKVFDMLGREIITLVNEEKQPGRYHVTWDASNVASGVYICRLESGGFSQTRKLLLVR